MIPYTFRPIEFDVTDNDLLLDEHVDIRRFNIFLSPNEHRSSQDTLYTSITLDYNRITSLNIPDTFNCLLKEIL